VPTGGKLPLGTFTLVSGSPSCPGGQSCSIEFKVSCPDVQKEAAGTLQVMAPGGSPRGLVMVFIGGLGTGFAQTEGVNPQFLHDLVGQGFEVVVDLWTDSWLQSAPGEQVGSARLGCRPATAIDWTYKNMYRKLGVGKKGVGVCGFCLTGNSGGSSQIAYALSLYGMGSIVNAAVMSGGPPHAAIAKGCLQQSGYAYDARSSDILDYSWGFADHSGPCFHHDASYTARWDASSVDLAGGVYDLPSTRIEFVFGSLDPTVGPSHGKDYLAKLRADHSPMVSEVTVQGAQHGMSYSPQGRATLEHGIMSGA
jgi:hypothetical protein